MRVQANQPSELDLDGAVAQALEAGRAAWAGVDLPADQLTAHARQVRARPADLLRHGADLYLACALVGGNPAALRIFEQRLLPLLVGPVRRLGIPATSVDDVLQNVSLAVIAGPRPRIASYAARSALFFWLRIVAIRIAVSSVRRTPAHPAGEMLFRDLVDGGAGPELEVTKLQLGPDLQRALEESLEKLPRRSKTILRMHYLDGLNIEAIGAVYRVHRATVARWLIAIRAEVMVGLRERFLLSPQATSSDFRSIFSALRDELQLSLERVLASPTPPRP